MATDVLFDLDLVDIWKCNTLNGIGGYMKIVSHNWAIMLILYEQHFSIATQEKRSEILSDEEQREHWISLPQDYKSKKCNAITPNKPKRIYLFYLFQSKLFIGFVDIYRLRIVLYLRLFGLQFITQSRMIFFDEVIWTPFVLP